MLRWSYATYANNELCYDGHMLPILIIVMTDMF